MHKHAGVFRCDNTVFCHIPIGKSDRRIGRVVVVIPASDPGRHGFAERIVFGAAVKDLDSRTDGTIVVDILGVNRGKADASVRYR